MRIESIKGKMILGMLLIVIFFTCQSLYFVYQLEQTKQLMDIQHSELDKQALTVELKESVQTLDTYNSNLIISKDLSIVEQYEEERKRYDSLLEQVVSYSHTPDQRQWKNLLTLVSGEYHKNFEQAVERIKEASTSSTEQLDLALSRMFMMSQAHKSRIFEMVDQYKQDFMAEAALSIERTENQLNWMSTQSTLLIPIILLINITIAIILLLSFTRPLKRLQTAVSHLSEGDLRHEIPIRAKDELGQLSQSFNEMTRQVRLMLQQSHNVASNLTEQAENFRSFATTTSETNKEMVQSIDEMAKECMEQADLMEKSAQLLLNMNEQVDSITAYTETMKNTSVLAEQSIVEGSASVHALHEASSATEDRIKHLFSAFDSLRESSQSIAHITQTIETISSQTNILALNASIEASRAGSAGKGFSVIADKVRELSNQTKQQTHSIHQQIEQLQSQIKVVHNEMSHTIDSFKAQDDQLQVTSSSFENIQHFINEMLEQNKNIHQQTMRANEQKNVLSESMQQVSELIQQTAARIEEISSTTQVQDESIHQVAEQSSSISQLAGLLYSEIQSFKIDDDNNTNLTEQTSNTTNSSGTELDEMDIIKKREELFEQEVMNELKEAKKQEKNAHAS